MQARWALFLSVLTSCAASPPAARVPTPAPQPRAPAGAVGSPTAPPASSPRFADPSLPPPRFNDPQRKAKLLAVVPQLDAHFADYVASTLTPGLAVGLVVDGELVWSKGYGVRDVTTNGPVDADTIFRLASVTKSFTSAAILQLRDAGKLSLDDPAEKYVPELAGVVYPTRDSPRITIRDLLRHSAGLPHDAPLRDDVANPASDAEMLASLQGVTLDFPPGSGWSYSNLGYQLAAIIVTRVSGTSYADYLASRLFRPLGMTSTSFDPPPDRLAAGYVRKGDGVEHPAMWKLGRAARAASGGLFSSVRDLARYATLQLSAWPPRDDADTGPVLRGSLREAQDMAKRARVWTPAPGAVGPSSFAHPISEGYGFGWVVQKDCELGTVVWHDGSLPDGYLSQLFLLPLRGVALFAMANLIGPSADLNLAVREGLNVLRASGALEEREPSPTPALLAGREAILSLLDRWDDAVEARAFEPAGKDEVDDYRKGLERLRTEHGACHLVSTKVVSAKELEWDLACDRRGQHWHMILGDTQRVRWSWAEGPPDPALAKAAARLTALVQRWDDTAYDALVAPMVNRAEMKARFAQAGAAHGSCKIDHGNAPGDKRRGHFVLACARGGPLELDAELDDKSGKLTSVTFGPPGRWCP
jgi:CubicO group peptidase (beta-lactamase class C family)